MVRLNIRLTSVEKAAFKQYSHLGPFIRVFSPIFSDQKASVTGYFDTLKKIIPKLIQIHTYIRTKIL
jgi:hypothetical protein